MSKARQNRKSGSRSESDYSFEVIEYLKMYVLPVKEVDTRGDVFNALKHGFQCVVYVAIS